MEIDVSSQVGRSFVSEPELSPIRSVMTFRFANSSTIGVRRNAWDSYLKDRKQYANYFNCKADVGIVQCEFPKDVLGSLLFIILLTLQSVYLISMQLTLMQLCPTLIINPRPPKGEGG